MLELDGQADPRVLKRMAFEAECAPRILRRETEGMKTTLEVLTQKKKKGKMNNKVISWYIQQE